MQAQLVSEGVLRQLTIQIGEPNLRILVDKVQRDVPLLWQQLNHAVEEKDVSAMLRSTHTLASVLKSVGLITIGREMSMAETDLRNGKPITSERLQQLKHAQDQAMMELYSRVN